MAPAIADPDPILHLRRRDEPPRGPVDPNYRPGAWTTDPRHINNRAFFALFAVLGVAMILTAIWFFFWAKNGGFRFRKGDWDDYKSTVLRRKGPNGTTLSGATRSTRLGGGSIVANEGGEEKGLGNGWRAGAQKPCDGNKHGRRGNKNNEDADVRAYRHEKPARVGGLNRHSDANTYTDEMPSVAAYTPINSPRTPRKERTRVYGTPHSNDSSESHRPLRSRGASPGRTSPSARHHRQRESRGPGRTSPLKQDYEAPKVPGSFMDEGNKRYSAVASEADTDDSRGTKTYFHPISGLDSGRKGRSGGYRRDYCDSLYDSE